MSVPAWREPVHVVMDEDVRVPQTAGGWRWLQSGGAVDLSDPALIVLADVVDTLSRAEDGVRETARELVTRLVLLYGLGPVAQDAA